MVCYLKLYSLSMFLKTNLIIKKYNELINLYKTIKLGFFTLSLLTISTDSMISLIF